MTMTRAEIQELFERWGAAWNARDQDAIMSMFTDDCYYEHLDGRSAVGKGAVRQLLFGGLGDAYGFQWRELIIDDVLQRIVETWDYQQPLGDGKTFTLHALDIYTVRDGKIAEKRVYGKSYSFVGESYVPSKPGEPGAVPASFGYRPTPATVAR